MPRGRGLLVYNPRAGGRDWRGVLREVMERAEARGLSLLNLPTERPRHATELVVRHLHEGPDVLVVAGGDGTVAEAVHGLLQAGAGSTTPVAVLPAGTANVVAREYGVGLRLADAERTMLSARTRPLTVFEVSSPGTASAPAAARPSLIGCGVGFDARVMTNIVPWLKRWFGRTGIGWTATLEWLKYEFPAILVEGEDAEGRPFRREATIVFCANVSRYGGDPILSPHADPADDLLELVLFTGRGKRLLLRFYHLISKGRAEHLSVPGVERLPVRSFVARSLAGYELEVQVDGDAAGATPVSVGPAAGHVSIVVPEADRGPVNL